MSASTPTQLDPLPKGEGLNKAAGESGRPNFRPSVPFTPERQAQYLQLLSQNGLVNLNARALAVAVETIRMTRKRDPLFEEAYQEALSQFRDRIEAEVFQRGMIGHDEPIFYMGVVVGWVRKPSDRMLELLAKRHVPEFREKFSADVKVTGGVLVVTQPAPTAEAWQDKFSEARNAPLVPDGAPTG
jgi:hypothetical protein